MTLSERIARANGGDHCDGRPNARPSCGLPMRHPVHRMTVVTAIVQSPFTRRALARDLPAKEVTR